MVSHTFVESGASEKSCNFLLDPISSLQILPCVIFLIGKGFPKALLIDLNEVLVEVLVSHLVETYLSPELEHRMALFLDVRAVFARAQTFILKN